MSGSAYSTIVLLLYWWWLSSNGCAGAWLGAGEACRPVALAMAAFRTCGKDGLMPQLKHGGIGVFDVADAGSKFDDTGFEKEQIVQTHVAVLELESVKYELGPRFIGDAVELRDGECAVNGELGRLV